MATVHGNSARQGLTALVDTAIMAGDNVPAEHVRSTFGQIFDLVVFLDREDAHLRDHDGPLRRQVMEVVAVPDHGGHVDGFEVESLLKREYYGEPLEWTGSPFPEPIRRRLDIALRGVGSSAHELLSSHPRSRASQ